MAHAIRNPLAITRAAAKCSSAISANSRRWVNTPRSFQTEIDRVDRLVEQLLAYARPFPLQRAPVAIGDVIARTVALTRAYAAQHRVELIVAIDADLPLVNGDAELLHQALVNLLLEWYACDVARR